MFEEILLRPENAAIMASVIALLTYSVRFFPTLMSNTKVVRFMPLAPLVLCVVGVLSPLYKGPEMPLAQRILVGLVLGAVAASTWKVTVQTLFGKDARLKKAS